MALTVWGALQRWLQGQGVRASSLLGSREHAVPQDLWERCLARHGFLQSLLPEETEQLARLVGRFLATKEFHGAQGLVITDDIAVTIAAQACLPLLHLSAQTDPLIWYDDFVGIVLYPEQVRAKRVIEDEMGLVHEYSEVIAGEAMPGGPLVLSWKDVIEASEEAGYNVVIHEFVHKLDMRDGEADGCPPLPPGFQGSAGPHAARAAWQATLHSAYANFREAVICAERFGADTPWLDAYGAQDPAEFFAVSSEAYFVNRARFATEFPALLTLYDAFYRTRQGSGA